MATYKHGVYASEKQTGIQTPRKVSAGIPFVVGTAPVNQTDKNNINKIVLCNTRDEAVAAFGYEAPKYDPVSKLSKYRYSLCEFIDSHFRLFGAAPVILVNVLDFSGTPTSENKKTYTEKVSADGTVKIEYPDGLVSAITGSENITYSYDYNGALIVSAAGWTPGNEVEFAIDFVPAKSVTNTEIIGGVDTSGKKFGLELVDECFPRFRVVPGQILAPGYSHEPAVAAIMSAKADSINGMFKAVCLIDVPTDTVKKYGDVAAWKTQNNIVNPNQIVCFPMLSLDGVLYHQSTQLSGLMCQVDADNEDVPYVSPSNKNYQMTAAVLADGTEVYLGLPEANTLNGVGVVTALNWVGGWKCWAVNTACYPDNTDVKDYLITNRRMFAYVNNNLILNHWIRVDNPLRRRQIDNVLTDANLWFNSLAAAEQIAGGRAEFLEADNPTTSVMEGISTFDVHMTPFAQNKEINFKIAYDPSYLSSLFN